MIGHFDIQLRNSKIYTEINISDVAIIFIALLWYNYISKSSRVCWIIPHLIYVYVILLNLSLDTIEIIILAEINFIGEDISYYR